MARAQPRTGLRPSPRYRRSDSHGPGAGHAPGGPCDTSDPVPMTELLRQVPPGWPRAGDPQYRFGKLPVVFCLRSTITGLARQKFPDAFPLTIPRQCSCHDTLNILQPRCLSEVFRETGRVPFRDFREPCCRLSRPHQIYFDKPCSDPLSGILRNPVSVAPVPSSCRDNASNRSYTSRRSMIQTAHSY